MSAEWTLCEGMYEKTTRGSGKLDKVQPKNWTLPFISEPHLTSCDPTDQYQIIEQRFERILKNNPHINQNILEILVGLKPRKNKQEDQLLIDA